MHIALASTDAEIEACYPVMAELRVQVERGGFTERVRHLMDAHGYRLAFSKDGSDVLCVAGFRIGENLAWNKYLYIEDLVVGDGKRSQGCGASMLRWLIRYARDNGCQQVHLDTGVQRYAAHRFYFSQRMAISSYHFSVALE